MSTNFRVKYGLAVGSNDALTVDQSGNLVTTGGLTATSLSGISSISASGNITASKFISTNGLDINGSGGQIKFNDTVTGVLLKDYDNNVILSGVGTQTNIQNLTLQKDPVSGEGQIVSTAGNNDSWRITGGSTGLDQGYLEINTGDNGNEPIYVRQYTGGSITRTFTVLDGSGNTSIPGNATVLGALNTDDITNGFGPITITTGSNGNLIISPNGTGIMQVNSAATITGELTLSADLRINGNDIKSSTGATVITLSDNDAVFASDLTVTDTLNVNAISIDTLVGKNTTSLTTTSTSQTAFHSFSASVFRSCRYTIQISRGTDYQVVECIVLHNGTNAFVTTFADIKTGTSNLATFDADISGGNVRLLVTPTSATSTAFIADRTVIVV